MATNKKQTETGPAGYTRDGHPHAADEHSHHHETGHHHHHEESGKENGTAVTVRAVSGLSGDMMLSGLAALADLDGNALESLVKELQLPALEGCLTIEPRSVRRIAGVGCAVSLPHEHAHRSLKDILGIINGSAMPQEAKNLSAEAFSLLAEAEAAVHGVDKDDVTFHEVGALDSILDICLVSRIFTRLKPGRFICSPLPLADGSIVCAHGRIPSPAPAVLRMLRGVPVRSFSGEGETVTPTALALLKSMKAEFGPWPEMVVEKTVISYGGKVFDDAPNGAVWAAGTVWREAAQGNVPE